METDRLFGWLIPKEYIDAFNKDFKNSKVDEKWNKYCSWAIPEVIDNKLTVKFE